YIFCMLLRLFVYFFLLRRCYSMSRPGLTCIRWLTELGKGGLAVRFSARCRSTCVDKEQMLFSAQVEFDPSGDEKIGRRVTLEAVYQDTMPSGSTLGTVIATHGSPGSHKDWKYITPRLQQAGVRVIGVNYPGFGISQDLPELTHENVERNAFVEALMSTLGLRENIVFMGHSRGSENALKLSARNPCKAVGTVLLNSPGLRIHRGIRPFSIIEFLNNTYERFPALRGILHYIMHKYYHRIGLRTSSGRVAMNSIKTMANIALHGQGPFQQMINEKDHIRVLFAFAGNDFLIEEDISREFSSQFKDRIHLICKTSDPREEAAASAEMKKAFLSDGRRTVTCEFVPDGHFLQKYRSAFIADAICAMLEAAKNDRDNIWMVL
ncbi:hypothetical protein PMAYCL1PPCAC_14873, partial [Pristionchus mayeri]